jgi:hypothetical protein
MTLTSAAANTCGIERVIRSGAELTILFQRSANYFYNIRFQDLARKPLPEPENSWQPYAVGIDGVVLYEKGNDVKTLPYLRAPLNQVLVLSDHHFGCNARVMEDGQKLRVEHGGGTVGGASRASVQEIQIELPNR